MIKVFTRKMNSKINFKKNEPRYRAVFHCSTLRSSYSLENPVKMTQKSQISSISSTEIFLPH